METPFTVCAAVLASVQERLEANDRTVLTALVCVGGLVVDDCCAGQLVVAPERIFRTIEPFPLEAVADVNCGNTIGVDLVVRVDRCVPTVDDHGNAPSIAEQEAAFNEVLTDAALVWAAIVSPEILGVDLWGDPRWERANVSQIFAGPEGGCLGCETRVTFGIPATEWCLLP